MGSKNGVFKGFRALLSEFGQFSEFSPVNFPL